MKITRATYYVSTGLLLALMGIPSIMYFFNIEEIMGIYAGLGFPGELMYFNGIAKILGCLAILIPKVPEYLKQFAYAGLLYVLLLAVFAHVNISDGQWQGAAAGLLFWAASYGLRGK